MMMSIIVNSSKLRTKNGDVSFTREDAVRFAEESIRESLETYGFKNYNAEVNLKTEGRDSDTVQKVDIKVSVAGKLINQSSHSRDVKRAINKAVDSMDTQLRRMKDKKISKKRARQYREEDDVLDISTFTFY